jgi:hypothetical protein
MHFRRYARRKSRGVWAVTVDGLQPCKAYSRPLPALANAVSRSIKNKRRGTRILNFAEFKKTAEKIKNARAKEQKQRRDTRDLKLAADAITQRKMDESAKIRTHNIEAANEVVDILLLGGLDEHMKKKKGKSEISTSRNSWMHI